MVRIALLFSCWCASVGLAHGQTSTWNVNANGSWQTGSNWNTGLVPNGPNAIGILGNIITTSRTVTLDAPTQLNYLWFADTAANAYKLASSATGNTLTTNAIYNGYSTSANPEINLAANSAGNLLAPTNLLISNYSGNGSNIQISASTTLASNSATGNIQFNFFNTTGNSVSVFGNIGTTGKEFAGGLLINSDPYSSGGVVFLLGNNSSLTGLTRVTNSGQLSVFFLDPDTSPKLSSTQPLQVFRGSSFFIGGTNTTVSQTVNNLVVGSGTNVINSGASAGHALTFNVGQVQRAAVGSTVNFEVPNPSNGSINTTTGNTNGLLGTGVAFATVYDQYWATASGGAIWYYTGHVANTFNSGMNTNITANLSPASFTTNSLRFDNSVAQSGVVALTLTGTNVIESGGILIASPSYSASYSTKISGGTLTAPSEMVIHQGDGQHPFSIESELSGTGVAVTKSGRGVLNLNGTTANTFTGTLNVGQGTVNLAKPAGVNAIGGNLTVAAGTVNVSDHNLPDTAVVNIVNGSITIGTETFGSMLHQGGSYFTAGQHSLTSTATALLLHGGGYGSAAGVFWKITGASGGSIVLATDANLTMTNLGFDLGGQVRPFVVSSNTATLNGTQINNGGVIKSGTGALVLNTNLSYTGATIVNQGNFVVNGSLASSTVTLSHLANTFASLNGSGVLAGNVVVQGSIGSVFSNYNYIDPGSVAGFMPGLLTLGGLNASTGETVFFFDLLGAAPGTEYDQLNITGTATLGTGSRLLVAKSSSFTPVLGQTFLLMVRGSGSSGLLQDSYGNLLTEGSSFKDYASLNFYSISYAAGDGNDIAITYVGVPEPATIVLMLVSIVGGIAVIWYRKRRQVAWLQTEVERLQLSE